MSGGCIDVHNATFSSMQNILLVFWSNLNVGHCHLHPLKKNTCSPCPGSPEQRHSLRQNKHGSEVWNTGLDLPIDTQLPPTAAGLFSLALP